jgi:alpha-tubulin suppressor-like RCC1 family protein
MARSVGPLRFAVAVLVAAVIALSLAACVADPPPRIGSATPGNGQATVSWSPPLGIPSPIAAYVVTPWVGSTKQTPVRFDSENTTQIVTGLTNGVGYTFSVHAVNALGNDSAESSRSNQVIVGRVPGKLYAWGSNSAGQLGIGSASLRPVPAQIGPDAWAAVADGQFHTVAIKTDGTLWAWGRNAQGQLGDGTTTNRTTPVQIGGDTNWATVAAGTFHTLAVKTDGTLWAWGANFSGQLGDGTTTGHTTPVQIGGDTNWATVAAGGSHALAVKIDGTLWAWGADSSGQLGDGATTDRTSPVQIGSDTDWAATSGGSSSTEAIKTNGTLWAWGSNIAGTLGDGTTTDRHTPEHIGTDTNWASVSAGLSTHADAVKTDGTLWAWGTYSAGELGDGTASGQRLAPVQIGTDTDWTSVTAGRDHTAAVKSDGSLWAWGANARGQLGDGSSPPCQNPSGCVGHSTPVRVGTDSNWSAARAGETFTTALKTDGTLWDWGDDQFGELGDNMVPSLATPTQVGTDTDWVSAEGGGASTLAIKADGSLWAWGNNSGGQLGDGTTISLRSTPVRIGADTDWATISGGLSFTMALKTDGSLWAWGNNSSGQLGDGTSAGRNSPAQVGTSTDWATVSADDTHTLAVKTDGTLWAWGDNRCGQLGDGTTTQRPSPVQIGTGTDWRSVSAGNSGSVALRADGTMWRWGSICPDSELPMTLTPTQADGSTNWKSVSTNSNAGNWLIATKSDGSLWNGKVVVVNFTPVFQISRVGTATDWASVTADGVTTAELTKTNGTLWTWTASTATTTQVGTATDWVSIQSGSSHALGIASP